MYDLATQWLCRSFAPDRDERKRAAVSADDRRVVVVGLDTDRHRRHTFTLYPLDHPNPAEAAVALPIRAGTFTTGIAFTPDGKRLLTSHNVGVAHAWDISRFTSTALNPRAGELWAALGSDDGEVVGKCMTELAQSPRTAVEVIAVKLLPAPVIDAKAFAALVTRLGDSDFRTREAATAELAGLGADALPLLKAAVPATAEAEARVEKLVAAAVAAARGPEWVRQARAVELLETIGGPDAVKVLTHLAAGAPGSRLTAEATSALKRLRSRR